VVKVDEDSEVVVDADSVVVLDVPDEVVDEDEQTGTYGTAWRVNLLNP
jgi:hypothetical protein